MQQPTDDVYGELIGDVYAAGLDAARWPEVLARMSSMLDSPAGTIFIHDFSSGSAHLDGSNGNVAAFLGFDEAALASYASYYSGRNVWIEAEDALPPGSAVTSSMLLPETWLRRTEFYSDWLRPQDFFYSLGSVVVKEQARAVKLSFLRSERDGAYGADELQVMKRLMPHLQTSVATHRRIHQLEALAAGALSGLDALRFGVVLLDTRGKVLHANAAAERIGAKTSAVRLGSKGEVLAATGSATEKLRSLMQQAALTGAGKGFEAGGSIQLPTHHGRPLTAFVTPLPVKFTPFGRGAAAALFFVDPDGTGGNLTQLLKRVYRMTLAEASLTEALISGLTLAEYAEKRGVTMNTLRTQLKSAAGKAGAKRQVDLVRVVLTGPAMLMVCERSSGSM